MTNQENSRWGEYYSLTKALPPSPLLVRAMHTIRAKEKALDMGAGALKDTKFLLEEGFQVTALDKEPLPPDLLSSLKNNNIHHVTASFSDFKFPENEYDLVSALFALPFNPPDSFNEVFEKIKKSLKTEGVFCGQLFGIRDEWQSKRPNMTFHTKEQVEELLKDMEVLYLNEDEKDGVTANGTPKHWHIFNIIARKK